LDAGVELAKRRLIRVSLDGIIVAWNRAAERIYGYPAQTIIGKPLSLLVPEDRRHELETTITSIARGATIEHFETIRLRSDGVRSMFPLSIARPDEKAG